MTGSFKGAHFPKEVILTGVHVDHSTINRWVIKYSPQLEAAFPHRKRPVWRSWQMDETLYSGEGGMAVCVLCGGRARPNH